MDGLTISNSQNLLESGQTLKEMRAARLQVPRASSPNISGTTSTGEKSFADTLKDVVSSVNEAQKLADKKAQALAVGQTRDIADVMITAEKADVALKLMVSVRNKIIEAYQEIMKMQV